MKVYLNRIWISVKQPVIFFFLLAFINLAAVIVMQITGLRKDPGDFKAMLPGLVWLSVFYWFTCQLNRTGFRLWFIPVFRIFIWTILVAHGIIYDDRMGSEDLLYANNSMFLWWELYKLECSFLRPVNVFAELFIEDILMIGVVEFLLIIASVRISKLKPYATRY